MKTRYNIIVVLIIACITAGLYFFYYHNSKTKKPGPIAIGKPCIFRELENAGGSIKDTGGLQCYFYSSPPPIGTSNIDAMGVWIKPNYISYPLFVQSETPQWITDAVKNWRVYQSKNGQYTFYYPGIWSPVDNEDGSQGVTIAEVTPNPDNVQDDIISKFIIVEHPNVNFETTADYKNIKDFPDNIVNNLKQIHHFDLNGTPAILVETQGITNFGPENTSVRVYVIKQDSYLTIYTNKSDFPLTNIPVEIAIKTLKFK
jgi:hypothetical protein